MNYTCVLCKEEFYVSTSDLGLYSGDDEFPQVCARCIEMAVAKIIAERKGNKR